MGQVDPVATNRVIRPPLKSTDIRPGERPSVFIKRVLAAAKATD